LLQKLPFSQGQNSVVLPAQTPGRIGIVRVVRGNEVYSGKFIY
jgi:hypothetical protein